jgi:(E)-4-hydroxy-3-methylbut-2-enyl-diphosphate synthase
MAVERRKTRQINVGPVAVGGDAPITVQSMTITKTADVEGTLRQIYALAGAGCDIVPLHVQRAGGGRGPGPDRAPVAGADHRRHPPPVPHGAGRSRRRRAGPAAEPGQHPQPEHIKAVAEEPATAASRSHRRERRLARPEAATRSTAGATPEAMVESAQLELAYFDEVGFDDVKISVKASTCP